MSRTGRTGGAAAMGPYRVLAGNRNLGLLFWGQVVSAFGDRLYMVMALDQVAALFQEEQALAQHTIIAQGECGDKLYIIKTGSVEVVATDGSGRERKVGALAARDFFGEIATPAVAVTALRLARVFGRRLRGGERDGDGGALADGTLDGDAPAVLLHDRLHAR